jgi:hypothetical protein
VNVPPCADDPGLHLFLSFGCSGGDGDAMTESGGATDVGGTSQPTTTGSPDGAPVVMELLSNAPGLTENEGIILTAIVVDPEGLDTIVGGKLTSEDGSAFYGAFAHIGGGTFQLALVWQMIGQTEKIQFMGTSKVRVFKADFFDVDGNHGYRTIEIQLNCADGDACASKCVSLADDRDNCGACGKVCQEGYSCMGGDCSYGY